MPPVVAVPGQRVLDGGVDLQNPMVDRLEFLDLGLDETEVLQDGFDIAFFGTVYSRRNFIIFCLSQSQ